jgi:hypothetical protein
MKPGRFEVAVLLLFVAIISYQLFIPPRIGISDNGDFARFLYQTGLQHVSTTFDDRFFSYFNSKYQIVPVPAIDGSYRSSTVLFIRAARWISVHFINNQTFDVSLLAAIYLVFLLFGIFLILISTDKLALKWRIALAVLLLVMFTDPAGTSYLNTFYSEPTALVSLVIIVGCSLVLIAGKSFAIGALVCYFIAAAIFITAKPMYLPLSPLFAGYGIYLSSLVGVKYRYWFSAIAACALLTLGVWYFRQTPEPYRLVVNFGGVFGVIAQSTTPTEDLRAMGLNPDWVRYAKSDAYSKDSPVNDPAFRAEFTQRVNTLTVPKFLLSRPSRLYAIVDRLSHWILTTRIPYAGYYEKASGKPPFTKPPAPWSDVRSRLFPPSIWFLAIYFSSGILTLAFSIRRQLTEPSRGLLLLYSLLVSVSAVAFLVPVLTQASLDMRYSSTYVAGFDMALILLTGAFLCLIRLLHRKLKPADRTVAG